MVLDIDAETYLEARITRQIDMRGASATAEQVFSDFRSVSGIMLPHTIVDLLNGQPQARVKVETIEINVPVEDTYFQPPQK